MPAARHFFRTLIVGDDQFLLSHTQYKRILLTGQLCLITIGICIVYFIFDLLNGISYSWPYELGCASLAFVSFLLNKKRKFTEAKFLLGFTVNIVVFVFAGSEPLETGIYMYFITISLGALVAFGFEERYKAMLFVLFSTSSFLISLFLRFPFVPREVFSDDYIRLNVLVNFIGSGWTSVCILYFLVTINHRWESALEDNQKEIRQKNIELTTLNANLDRFVYSTSHDLRSPLKSLRGLIHIAQITNEPGEVRSLIGEMKMRIDHLEKFITDIADYSRNRTQDVFTQSVQVKKILLETLESLRYFPGAGEMLLHVEVDDDLVVVIDNTRLQIILNNLLSNAIKYKDPNKEKSFVMIRMEYISGSLVVTVEDNGIGIPADYLQKIFDMYVRAHEHAQGTGLGLYIMKEAVEKLGGTIRVESKVLQGTSFVISVPATRVEHSNGGHVESLPA